MSTRSGRSAASFPASRLIVLTTYDGDEDIYRALEAGAQAYLLKDMICDEILAAIRAVHAGQRRIPAAVGTRLAERMTALGLSEQEQRVLDLVATGKSNKEIAAALEIAEATVRAYMTNALGKLGVTDRTQAVITAIQRVSRVVMPPLSLTTAVQGARLLVPLRALPQRQ